MIDHVRLLNEVRSRETLDRAFAYAINDRRDQDYFVDFFELEDALEKRSEILAELEQELAHPEQYIVRHAFAYFPPKSHLCYRRMVYVPLKDLGLSSIICS
jgi:hypothetical protein